MNISQRIVPFSSGSVHKRRYSMHSRRLLGIMAGLAILVMVAPATRAAEDGGLVTDTNSVLPNVLAVVGIAGPVTIGLVQAIKAQGLPSRFAPVVTLASGLVIAGLLVLADVAALTAGQTVLTGVLTGLTAGGFYSGVKALAKG